MDNIGQWVYDVMVALGYLGLMLLLIVENLFPPIPSEVVLPLAGFFVGRGEFSFMGALAASTLGSVIGALILYVMGRWGGRPLVLRYGKWLRVTSKELDRADAWFDRYGDMVVLFARIIPLARSVVSIPAGTTRMPVIRFTILTTIGSAVWNLLLIGGGYILGANWERISEIAGAYSDIVLIGGAIAAALYLLLRHYRNRNA